MLQINSYNLYSTPIKPSVNFGRKSAKETEENEGGLTPEEIKAEKLVKLAQKAKEADKPSAFKSFTIVAALTGASALTAAALFGRLFNVMNGVGMLKAFSARTMKLLEKSGSNLAERNLIQEGSSFKNKISQYAKKGVDYLQDLAQNGTNIEAQVRNIKTNSAAEINKLKKAIRKEVLNANKGKNLTKTELNAIVKDAIKNDEKIKKELEMLNINILDAQGANLLKKGTKATAATVTGVGALSEASTDNDNNGVPDCVEYKKAHKEATQKVTAAILDCALDSFC